MAIDLISKIKPKNNGKFALVDAADIELPNGTRLDAYVETQKSSVESLQANDRAFSEQVAALAAKDAAISEDIEALKNKDSNVGDSIAALIAKDLVIDNQISDLAEKDAAFEGKIADLEEKDASITAQISALADKDAAVGKQIESLGAKDTAIDAQIAGLVAKDSETDKYVEELAGQFSASLAELAQSDKNLADADQELANRTKALEDRFADMDYGDGIVFTSFSHNRTGTYEIGEKINSLALSWAFDRVPTTQILTGPTLDSNGVAPDISGKSYSYPITGVEITSENQPTFRWRVTATDNRGKTINQISPGFTFLNGVYYGAAALPDVIDRAFILGLTKKLSSQKVSSFTVNAEEGEYIWYCLPSRPPFGACTFIFGANEVTFELVDDAFEFENSSGYIEPYYIYRSANAGLGNTTMGVK